MPYGPFQSFQNAYRIQVQITGVQGDIVQAQNTTSYLDGTSQTTDLNGNLTTGAQAPWIVYTTPQTQFNRTETRVYAAQARSVGIVDITKTELGATGRGIFVWDLSSGFLMEENLTVQASGIFGSLSGSLHLKVSDFGPKLLPDFTISATPASMLPGLDRQVPINITSINNFQGGLTLSAINLPTSINVTIALQNTYPSLSSSQTTIVPLVIEHPKAGLYQFLLIATNGSITHKTILDLTVGTANVTISASPNHALTGQTVTVTFAITGPYSITSVSIDWGDGSITHTSTAASSDSHVYATTESKSSHTFTIVLTASTALGDGFGQTAVIVNDRPPTLTVTGIAPNPVTTGQQLTVSFNAQDPDGTIASFSINWGDRATSTNVPGTSRSQTHTYNSAGQYTITILATDDAGSTSPAYSSTVTVTSPPSQAPASPPTTILGLVPAVFFGIVGAAVAVAASATLLILARGRKGPVIA